MRIRGKSKLVALLFAVLATCSVSMSNAADLRMKAGIVKVTAERGRGSVWRISLSLAKDDVYGDVLLAPMKRTSVSFAGPLRYVILRGDGKRSGNASFSLSLAEKDKRVDIAVVTRRTNRRFIREVLRVVIDEEEKVTEKVDAGDCKVTVMNVEEQFGNTEPDPDNDPGAVDYCEIRLRRRGWRRPIGQA